jgi:heme exporter protein CcmD
VNWNSAGEFFAMGGYGLYVWGAYAVTIACMAAGVWSVRRGLASIGQLRSRLSAVHRNQGHRVEGAYPSEVQPLVDDLNGLLDYREQIVRRAIAKAGDLAHALKTPLAVLAHEADVADRAGQGHRLAVVHVQRDRPDAQARKISRREWCRGPG